MSIFRIVMIAAALVLISLTCTAKDNNVLEIHVAQPREDQYLLGSGFAITDEGTYITAQHVVAGCKFVSVLYDGAWVLADSVKKHSHSDAAVVHISEKTVPVRINTVETFTYGKMFGYPGSQNYRFYNRDISYVAEQRIFVTGAFAADTIADIWHVANENKKNPMHGNYSGMSGGPLLDSKMHVMGIMIAENANEPYIISIKTRDILDIISEDEFTNNQSYIGYPKNKNELIKNSTVTQIYCGNDEAGPR